jgi:hypothetical protein
VLVSLKSPTRKPTSPPTRSRVAAIQRMFTNNDDDSTQDIPKRPRQLGFLNWDDDHPLTITRSINYRQRSGEGLKRRSGKGSKGRTHKGKSGRSASDWNSDWCRPRRSRRLLNKQPSNPVPSRPTPNAKLG